MEPTWVKTAIIFGFIQSAIVLYLISSKKRYVVHRFFMWTVIVLMLMQLEAFVMRLDNFSYFVHFINSTTSLVFLLGPLLFFYIRDRMSSSKLRLSQLWHLLPWLFYTLYSFYFYLQPAAFKYNAAVAAFHPDMELLSVSRVFQMDPWNIQGLFVVELFTAHLLGYCLFSFYSIRRYKRINPKITKATTNWLLYVSGIMSFGALIMFFSQGGVIDGKVFLKSPFPYYSADVSTTVAMYFVMFYLILKPGVLKIKMSKYENSSLSDTYKKEKLRQLIDSIERDKLYLNSNFSLRSLSESSKLSPHHISQILNEELQLTFFELTNDYRIKEAMKRLSVSDDYIKMEQLAYDLGYGSKSTFYTAFKKATNLTPSNYRKSLI